MKTTLKQILALAVAAILSVGPAAAQTTSVVKTSSSYNQLMAEASVGLLTKLQQHSATATEVSNTVAQGRMWVAYMQSSGVWAQFDAGLRNPTTLAQMRAVKGTPTTVAKLQASYKQMGYTLTTQDAYAKLDGAAILSETNVSKMLAVGHYNAMQNVLSNISKIETTTLVKPAAFFDEPCWAADIVSFEYGWYCILLESVCPPCCFASMVAAFWGIMCDMFY